MAYDPDTVWNDWVKILEQQGRQVFSAVYDGRWRGFDEWTAFVDGRSMADVGIDLGRSTAEVTDMNTAYNGLNAIATFLDTNAAPLRKFT